MLIREVAYSIVPRAERRARHAAVARHAEAAIDGAGETLSSILAYHWREAGEPARAIPYLLAAADAARRSWASGAVVDLYSRALELAEDDELRRRIALREGCRARRARRLSGRGRRARRADSTARRPAEARRAARARPRARSGPSVMRRRSRSPKRRCRSPRRSATTPQSPPRSPPRARHWRCAAPTATSTTHSSSATVRSSSGFPERGRSSLRHHLHLHANTTCWVGEYERSVSLSQRTRALASDVKSAESLLRGGGLEALALTGPRPARRGDRDLRRAVRDRTRARPEPAGRPQLLLARLPRSARSRRSARAQRAGPLALGSAVRSGCRDSSQAPTCSSPELLAGDIGARAGRLARPLGRSGEGDGLDDLAVAGRLACGAGRDRACTPRQPSQPSNGRERAIEIARRTRRRKYEGAFTEMPARRSRTRPARRGDADPPLRRRCCGRARRPAAPLAGTRRPGPRRVRGSATTTSRPRRTNEAASDRGLLRRDACTGAGSPPAGSSGGRRDRFARRPSRCRLILAFAWSPSAT